MQEFDYSNETSNDLYDAVDGLSYEEAVFAKEAIEKIKEEGYDVTTSIVVTNHTKYSKIERNGSRAIEKKPFLLLKGEKK